MAAKRGHVDTRTSSVRWLASRVRPNESVLVSEELSILPGQLRAICGRVVLQSQRSPIPTDKYDWVVLGDLDRSRFEPLWENALNGRPQSVAIGSFPMTGTAASLGISAQPERVWHNNVENVRIFGPQGAAERAPRAPCTSRDRPARPSGLIKATPGTGTAREGGPGVTELRVPVSLAETADRPLRLEWQTVAPKPGFCAALLRSPDVKAASAPRDYAAATGTLIIPRGAKRGAATIRVNGDSAVGPDRCFLVAFTSVDVRVGGLYGLGIGVIRDDDR